MKKFTLLFIAVLTAVAMVAAPVQKGQWQAPGNLPAKSQKACKSLKKSPAAKMLKVANAPAGDELIWDQPEGNIKYYYEWGNGYELYDGKYLFRQEANTAGRIVWTDDNVVYIQCAISSLRNNAGWVKGSVSKDGKKITVKYPQLVNYLYGTDEDGKEIELPLYVSVMKLKEGSTDDYAPVADEENVVTYTVADDGKILMDGSKDFEWGYDPETEEEYVISPETMLSCYYEYYEKDGSGPFPWWFGYADIAQKFTPLPNDIVVNEYPDGLTYEKWSLTDAMGMGQSVDVALAGNGIYIKDIDLYTKDYVVKGTIEGNKVTFPSKQFLGIIDEYNDYVFFSGDTYGEQWYEEFQDYYEGYALADKLVMDYDPETKTLTAPENTGFMMNSTTEDIYYYSAFLQPVIRYQSPEELSAPPCDPQFWGYENRDDLGQEYFVWGIYNMNLNYAYTDADRMYYNVFVDGELFTFSPDVYPYVSEEITNVPYNYSDDDRFDIYCNREEHGFFIYGQGMESFGIKVYYLAPNGRLYSSNRVTYYILEDRVETDQSGIDEISAEPVSMEFTSLQGIKVANPEPGNIYIRTITFKDGSKKSSIQIVH